jgi:hypothetical protein
MAERIVRPEGANFKGNAVHRGASVWMIERSYETRIYNAFPLPMVTRSLRREEVLPPRKN